MFTFLKLLALVLTFRPGYLINPSPCVIDLECDECLPENMPLITSHGTENGSVTVEHGGAVTLACGVGRFLRFPALAELRLHCDAGRYRAAAAPAALPLLDLGCQESVFEDVLHDVAECAPPLQGRVYRVRAARGDVRHVAALCYDADAGVARRALAASDAAALALPPHEERAAPLSLLGNFDQMFDASTRHAAAALYADDERLGRRLREMYKHDGFCFAAQTLTSAPLLSAGYFRDRSVAGGVAALVSNRVAVWRGVARGNLRHVQRDVAALAARRAGGVRVLAGTLGVAAPAGRPLYLRAGRFPVPRYVWTAVYAPAQRRGAVLVVLNDPLVAVSEVRDAVFCESACGELPWLRDTTRHRHFERAAAGLTFCCTMRDFAAKHPDVPTFFNETVDLLV